MGVLAEAFTKIGSDVNGHALCDVSLRFLLAAGVPSAIANDLCLATYEQGACLCGGAISVFPSRRLAAINASPLYLPWFRDGYLSIASGACGDPIVLDITTGKMGYIIHDEMDHRAVNVVPSKHVIHSPFDFDEYWDLAAQYDLAIADPSIGFAGLNSWILATNYIGVPVDAESAELRWGRSDRRSFIRNG